MKKYIKYIVLILVFIVFVISGFVITKNNKKKIEEKKNEIIDISLEEEKELNSVIKFKNLDNAEIIDGEKVNNSSKIKKEHVIRNADKDYTDTKIVITDMKLYSNSEENLVYCDFMIKNTDEEKTFSGVIEVYLFNKDGVVVYEFTYNIDDLLPGVSRSISVKYNEDFINAYDYNAICIDSY